MPIRIVCSRNIRSLLASRILAALVELELPFQFARLLVYLLLFGLRVNIGNGKVWVLVCTYPHAKLVCLHTLAVHGSCHRRIELAVYHLHRAIHLYGLAILKLLKCSLVSLLVILQVRIGLLALTDHLLSLLLVRHHLNTSLLGYLRGNVLDSFVYFSLSFCWFASSWCLRFSSLSAASIAISFFA